MANTKTVSSPNENIAAKEALAIQTAETRIKQLIVEARYKGYDKQELSSKIAQVIAETAQVFKGAASKQQVRRALAMNAQRWNYLYRQNLDVINASLEAKLGQYFKEEGDPEVQVEKTSYTIGFTGMEKAVSEFRDKLTVDSAGLAIIKNYEKQVREQMAILAADPANLHRIDKNGKPYKVHLRNFAEMEVRYRASMGDLKNLKESGVKLVWTTSHPDSSGRCAPYQGRLYSLDGSSGMENGVRFEPIDEALMGPKGDGNGIINGYNCRHRLVEYTPGSKSPTEYDSKTIRNQNAINTKQRAMEREIRLVKTQKRLAKSAGMTQLEASLEKKQAILEKNYQNFSIKNGRAFYSWRTTVGHEEFKWIKDDVQLPPIPNYALAGSQPIPEQILMKDSEMTPIPDEPSPVVTLDQKLASHVSFTPKRDLAFFKPAKDIDTFNKTMSKTFRDFKKLLADQKMTEKPLVLPESEFKEVAAKSGFVLYRGYHSDKTGETMQYREELKKGEFYVENSGGAAYGRGMYSAHIKANVDERIGNSPKNDALNEAAMYAAGGREQRVDRMTMLPDAKIATLSMVREQAQEEFLKGCPDWYAQQVQESMRTGRRPDFSKFSFKERNIADELEYQRKSIAAGDLGGVAVKLGYDAMLVEHNQYFVILNRSKLVISTRWYEFDPGGYRLVEREEDEE